MKMIKAICRELTGLFVDDGSLALAILALLAVSALLMSRGMGRRQDQARSPLLVAGSIGALIETSRAKSAQGITCRVRSQDADPHLDPDDHAIARNGNGLKACRDNPDSSTPMSFFIRVSFRRSCC